MDGYEQIPHPHRGPVGVGVGVGVGLAQLKNHINLGKKEGN